MIVHERLLVAFMIIDLLSWSSAGRRKLCSSTRKSSDQGFHFQFFIRLRQKMNGSGSSLNFPIAESLWDTNSSLFSTIVLSSK